MEKSYKQHIKHIENKIAKNIALLFKAKPFLNKQSFYLYTIHTFKVTLTVSMWLGKVHI